MPVYRGGEKFKRALDSIRHAENYFRRIVISLNSAPGSADEEVVRAYQALSPTKVEVIQTERELPWIPHQFFWLSHLEQTGEHGNDWVMWFAHDDEIRPRGLAELVNTEGSWPLEPGTIYLGPWGMRYDPPGEIFSGDRDAPLESWTSFPLEGPRITSVASWIADQLRQPTYINMSGCVTQLAAFQQLRNFPYAKPGGMRIEMATAAAPVNRYVAEFPTPIVITYTSKGSDRTTYTHVARKDDAHLMAWLANYVARHPGSVGPLIGAAAQVGTHRIQQALGRRAGVAEDWRRRETVDP